MRKSILLVACSLLLTFALAIPASAYVYTNEVWYVLDKPNDRGADHNLTAAKKEYALATAHLEKASEVKILLLKKSFMNINDTWYPDNQFFQERNDNRAWWYGDTSGNRTYYLRNEVSSGGVAISGFFRNFL